jgi:PAS domain S-box-containing protein
VASDHTLLPDSARLLRLLIDALPAGIWITDADLHITWISEGRELRAVGLQREDLVGRTIGELHREGGPAVKAHRRALAGEAVGYESQFAGRWFSSQVEPVREEGGAITGVLGVALDITDRKRAEDALAREEAHVRVVTDQMPAVLWSTDRGLRFTSSTGRGLAALKLRPGEVVGTSLTQFFGTDDPTFVPIAAHRRALDGHHSTYMSDFGGRTFQAHVEPFRDVDGRIVGVVGAALDITERRDAEEELRRLDRERIRLLRHLVGAHEDERRRIAAGLHDDSIQRISALALRLHIVARRVEDTPMREDLVGLERDAEEIVVGLRTMLFDLVPPALEEGLGAALDELLRTAAEEDPEAPSQWRVDDRLGEEPEPHARVLLYRLAQEAIANVRKHARASRVDVLIEDADEGISVRVRDDGRGFAASERLSPPGHFGLVAMRERAEMAGGWWRVDSRAGAGTTVTFWIPRTSLGEAAPGT